jgi:hypothetical protein
MTTEGTRNYDTATEEKGRTEDEKGSRAMDWMDWTDSLISVEPLSLNQSRVMNVA